MSAKQTRLVSPRSSYSRVLRASRTFPYLTYGVDNNHTVGGVVKEDSNRVIIERDGVAKPGYAVLMFPFRTGQAAAGRRPGTPAGPC